MSISSDIRKAVAYHTDEPTYTDADDAAQFYIGDQLRIRNLIEYSRTAEGSKNPAVMEEIAKSLGFHKKNTK